MSVLHYDLCVIGGGINGAGIARDAAGRGLSVLLVETQDLAGATSSASTKLIHGGLRYLEQYAFGMVRGALREREILYKTAPHLVRQIECVLPYDEVMRPQWLIKSGLYFYDRLGGKSSFARSEVLDFTMAGHGAVCGTALNDGFSSGFSYSDGWGDDTRLVIMNAVDAAARSARVVNYTSCDGLSVVDGVWRVSLRDQRTGEALDVSASMVVNATGPWVRKFLDSVGIGGGDHDLPEVRLVKGSHIILPRLYDGDHAYVLQQPDGRVVFVTPYEDDYTIIGTTEEEYGGDPRDVHISECEISYLLSATNRAFSWKIKKTDMIFTYSGVRPLISDGKNNAKNTTRDYSIYHHRRYDPPMLSVFGGKLTTYRILSEKVVNKLMLLSGRTSGGWTAFSQLAGGDFGAKNLDEFIRGKQEVYPWMPVVLLRRYARNYGTRMDYFLGGTQSLEDLGEHYGDNIYANEVEYLVFYEWATSAEDIVWRRSKLGMMVSEKTIENIEAALLAGFG